MQLPLFFRSQSDEDKAWLSQLPVVLKRRAFQKTISIRIPLSGEVRVSCSKTCPVREVNAFLLKNKDWIEQSLAEAKKHNERFPEKTFEAGEEFLFLGRRLPLVHRSSQRKRPRFLFAQDKLILDLGIEPYSCRKKELYEKAMIKFYKSTGETLLSDMVAEESRRMSLYPKKVSYRSQKSRWGSCSSEGHISLNWRLVCGPVKVARYVVVHELAHLKHQNHSLRFWNLVEKYCPEHKSLKAWLHKHQHEYDFLTVSGR